MKDIQKIVDMYFSQHKDVASIKSELKMSKSFIFKVLEYNLYFKKHEGIDAISKELNLSKPAILKTLKKAPEKYSMERRKRISKANMIKQKVYTSIQKMYFEDGFTPKEISEDLSVSKSTVTRALQASDKYSTFRKNKSNLSRKHNDDAVIASLLVEQRKHAISMSKSSRISDIEIIKLNLQHYKYNPNDNSLVFNENSGKRPNDIPNVHFL